MTPYCCFFHDLWVTALLKGGWGVLCWVFLLFGFFFHSNIKKRFQDLKAGNQVWKIMTKFHKNGNLVFLLSHPIMMINKKTASAWAVPPPTHTLSFFLQTANDYCCNCWVPLIIGKECILSCCLFWVCKADIHMILLSELINCHQIRDCALTEFNLLFSICGKLMLVRKGCYPCVILVCCSSNGIPWVGFKMLWAYDCKQFVMWLGSYFS